MLEFCIANNIGISAAEEHGLWLPGDNHLPPKKNFWLLTKFTKYFLYPLAQEKWVVKTALVRLAGLFCSSVAAAELVRWLGTHHLRCDFMGASQPRDAHANALPRQPVREDNCMRCPAHQEQATSGNESAPQDTATYSLLSSAEGQMSLVQALEIMR